MSDLLSPSESHEFHSFLSSIDYTAPNDARGVSSAEWNHYSSEGIPLPQPPHGKGKEALTKATKDLMSLDSSSWGAASSMNNYQNSHGSYLYDAHSSNSPQYGFETPQNNSHNSPYHTQHSQHRATNVTFPFLSKQPPYSSSPSLSQNRSDSPGSMPQSLDQIDLSTAPIHTTTGVNHPNHSGIRSSSAKSPPIGTSSSSASSFSSHNLGAGASNAALSSLQHSEVTGTPQNITCKKRALDSSSQPSSSKRHRPSPPSTSGTNTKSSLLSPSQKKANHIQSEQKRRANIRRGYEALCETVPALREAIRQEEDTQQTNGVSGSKGSTKARRGSRRGKVDETGEKVDGRAGPRSENIVLGKTIEYINELLTDRETLLGRLRHVKSSLGPHHPTNMTSSSEPPLWERVWNGGSGKDADAEDEEEEDGDE